MAPQGNDRGYPYSEDPPPPPPPTKSFDDPVFQEDLQDFQRRPASSSRLVSFLLGMLTLTAVALGSYFFLKHDDIDLSRGASQHENFQGSVSLAAIEFHSVPEDCWLAIHGNVYDMTEYAPIHPGLPSLITRHCGTDATAAYDFEHSVVLLPIVNEYLMGVLDTTASPTTAPSKAPTSPTVAPSPPTTPPTLSPTERGATRSPTSRPTTSPPTLRPTPRPTPPPTAPWGCPIEVYTLADIAQHPNANSCWYALYGVVYDFTNYIDEHKGGRGTILAECGTDATVNFANEKKHDVALLIKKGFSSMIIGRLGTTRGTGRVACDEVDLVAVTNV